MPYNSVDELPEFVQKYPDKVKRMWMHVFNSTFTKTGNEARAFKAANSTINRRMEKFGIHRYGHQANFTHMVNEFIGNLED